MDIQRIVVSVLPILIAITFHEVAHGYVANKLGDPTAKMMGRLTLNPIAHIDLIGTILIPLVLFFSTNGQFVFGYAKPVPINPFNFKNPKKDMAISAAAGPITNIILAALCWFIYSIIPGTAGTENSSFAVLTPIKQMWEAGFGINLVLAVINLVPIPPLDGGRILVGILPHEQAVSYSRIEPFVFIIIMVLFISGIAQHLLSPLITILGFFIQLFVGLLINLFLMLLSMF